MPNTARAHTPDESGQITWVWAKIFYLPNSHTTTSQDISDILSYRHPPIDEVVFDKGVNDKKVFSGGFVESWIGRVDSIIYEKEGFADSGYSSIMRRDGSGTGYSIATDIFMQMFAHNNSGTCWFSPGHGRPAAAWKYNFGSRTDSFIIGQAYFTDSEGRRASTPIYIIGKNGEWVLGKQAWEEALKEINA